MYRRMVLVLGFLVTMCSTLHAQGFGIAGWTYDPITIATRFTGHSPCDRPTRLANVQGAMDSMLTWCDSLGYQRLMVDYDDPSYFDYFIGHQVKAINTLRPGIADFLFWSREKTVQAQWPGWMDYDLRGAFRKESVTQRISLDGHVMDRIQQQNPDTMWFPSNHSNFRGWGTGNYMPIHFQITCAAHIDSNSVGTFPDVAIIYWFVRDLAIGGDPTDKDGEEKYFVSPYSCGNWTRYPAITLSANLFEGHDREVITYDTTIYTSPGTVRFALVQGTDWQEPIPHIRADSNSFTGWHPVRIGVNYLGGNHEFNLEKIEIWDEDFNKLCVTRDAGVAQSIADAYYAEYQGHENTHAGWMLDDFLYDVIQPMARIMEIVHDDPRGMPGFYSSSFNTWFQRFYALLDAHGTPRPIQCNEQYWLGADGECRGQGVWENPLTFLLTDSSSDTPYLTLTPSETCTLCTDGGISRRGVNGHESIQFALDQGIWSEGDYAAELNTMYPGFTDNWQAGGGMIAEIDSVHARGETYWALLQSGRWGTFGINDCGGDYWARYPIREPSPNEVKLQAWMAVACDADGIMWYGTLSYSSQNPTPTPQEPFYSGFFEWGNGTPDPLPDRDNFCDGPRQVYRTERYWAAKDFHEQIHRITPLLDSLEFKGTLASRKFLQNYGTPENPQVMLRTVSQPLPPCYRSEEPIYSYLDFIDTKIPVPPDSTPEFSVYLEESPDSSYVQVSRWESFGNNQEEFWFLIINRRALGNETRTVTLGISNVQEPDSLYMVEEMISGQTHAAIPYLGPYGMTSRCFSVTLAPGDAELVHYHLSPLHDLHEVWVNGVTSHRADSTSIILRWPTVTQTDSGQAFNPYYYMVIGSDTCDQGYSAVSCTPDNYFIDRSMLATHSKHFYQVKAIGFLQPLTSATIAAGTKTKTKIRKQARI